MATTHDVTLTNASVYTRNFRTAYPGKIKGGKIPKTEIQEILSQAGCAELRYYFCIDDPTKPNEISVIFVGVDANGNDMIAANNALKNNVAMCPPVCGVANVLNQ
jgi:hypothetical protein